MREACFKKRDDKKETMKMAANTMRKAVYMGMGMFLLAGSLLASPPANRNVR
jgi:hypothetical protein